MTREEKIMRARGLRRLGWTAPQIGEALGVSPSTIRNWYLGGDCVDCGVPLDGSKGVKPDRCIPCQAVVSGAERKVWDRRAIIEAFRAWAQRHGSPPAVSDWRPWQARHQLHDPDRAREFENGGWPCPDTVIREFGSWNAGMEAAGFDPRPAHDPGAGRCSATSRPERQAA